MPALVQNPNRSHPFRATGAPPAWHPTIPSLIAAFVIANATVASPLTAQELPIMPQEDQRQFDNAIAAVVEDEVITYQDVHNEAARLAEQVRRASRNAQEFQQRMRELEDEIIQSKIDRILIVKAFEKEGYQIPPSYIDNEINEILMREFDGDRGRMLGYLREHGMSMREFREDTRREIILRFMRSQMRQSEAIVSPVRIERYYEDNREQFRRDESMYLRIIRLSGSDARDTADTIMEELADGADFADLAREYSRDRRQQGGSWGWVNASDLREDWREIASGLERGEHSDAIGTGGSDLFILHVEDRRESGIAPLREVREEIEEILVSRMAREAQERWLERLRRDAYVRHY